MSSSVEERVKKLENALRMCELQFAYYAQQHRAKWTPEGVKKAHVNEWYANLCRDVLKDEES